MKDFFIKARAAIQREKYHGIIKDVAAISGKSERTVQTQLTEGAPETRSTELILRTALDLIQGRRDRIEERLAKYTPPSPGDLQKGEEDPV